MMRMEDKCFLNVNWNDLEKNTHRVGFLCLYGGKFYFKIRGLENIPRAYDQGFGGIPGVQAERVYVSSSELFNILKKRLGIRETGKEDMDIIREVLGKKIESEEIVENRRDRINFEKMNEREQQDCQQEIDELMQLQAEKKDESR